MEPHLRAAYNAAFSPELYARYRARLEGEVGNVPFRLAECPLFIPAALRDRLMTATSEVIAQLAEPARAARLRRAIPADFDVPKMDEAPCCMTVDFAVVRGEDGRLDGRVVEMQAFPSLYAFTMIQARIYDELFRDIPGLEARFHCFARGYDFESGAALYKDAVLAGHDPAEVALLEIDPPRQKTLPDFVATQTMLGIEPVCVTQVVKRGKRLYRQTPRGEVPIRRVFNRVVFDELEKKRPQMGFSFTDELDLTWCPHPNWYWAWSKFSLPELDHPLVPKTRYLSELDALPDDLSGHVLKPLFSFAGTGVVLDPTAQDVASIPPAQRSGWVLQQKVSYARDLVAVDGGKVAAEVRILCLRPKGAALPVPFMNLGRLSRGKMLGVDHNRDFDWVGSTVALWPVAE
jgi:hypothetical protein